MPRVPFESLPEDARVWVFGSSKALDGAEAGELTSAVTRFLDDWAAHGLPLTSALDWREHHFLTIAVDQRDAHASGCSIDGLYRYLRDAERRFGTSLLGGGRVFYRDPSGTVHCVSREEFSALAERGKVDLDTPVFDLTVASLGEWLDRFEAPAGRAWQRELIGASSATGS